MQHHYKWLSLLLLAGCTSPVGVGTGVDTPEFGLKSVPTNNEPPFFYWKLPGKLAFVSERLDGTETTLRDPQTGDTRRFGTKDLKIASRLGLSTVASAPYLSRPAWSPLADQLGYYQSTGVSLAEIGSPTSKARMQLYIADAAGQHPSALKDSVSRIGPTTARVNGADFGTWAWAPDGRHVAYSRPGQTSHGQDTWKLMRSLSDGSERLELTEQVTEDVPVVGDDLNINGFRSVTWSPDGRTLATVAEWRHLSQLGLLSANGSYFQSVQNLVINGWEQQHGVPQWLPDGNELLYGTRARVYRAPNTLLNPTMLQGYEVSGFGVLMGKLSPNGRQVGLMDDGLKLAVMDTDGSHYQLVPLPQRLFVRQPPVWSPDGSYLAFPGSMYTDESEFPGTSIDIYVVRPDGSGLRNVTNTPDANEWDLAWGAD